MAIQVPNLFAEFMAGRDAREAQRARAQQAEREGLQTQLLQQRLQAQPEQMADEAKLRQLEIQGAEQGIATQNDAKKQRAYQQIGSFAQQALKASNPRAAVQALTTNPAYASVFAAAGFDPSKIDVNSPSFEQDLQAWASMGPQVDPDTQYRAAEAEKQRKFEIEQRMAEEQRQRQFTAEQNELNRRATLDSANLRADAAAEKQNRTQGASLRKEFRGLQSVKDYEAVLPLIESAKNAPDTKQGDLNLIYTVGKIYDPGSVVREGELKLTQDAAPFVQQLIGKVRAEVSGKGRLTPQTRKELLDSLNERVSAYQQAYTRDYDTYSQYARDSGMDMNSIVGARPETAYGGGQPGGQQPAGPKSYTHRSGAKVEILD